MEWALQTADFDFKDGVLSLELLHNQLNRIGTLQFVKGGDTTHVYDNSADEGIVKHMEILILIGYLFIQVGDI